MKTVRISIIEVLVILYFVVDPYQVGYSDTSPLYTHVTYTFAHANLLHLTTNLIAFYFVFNLLHSLNIVKAALVFSFVSAVAASFVYPTPTPTVGASGVIYAMMAAPVAAVLARRLRVTNSRKLIRTYAIIAVATIIQMFILNVNAAIHIASFAINLILLFTFYKIKQHATDITKTTERKIER